MITCRRKLFNVGSVWICALLVYLTVAVKAPSKVKYISTEHPKLTYTNSKYVKYANLTSRRLGREDPLYYMSLHVDLIWPVFNNINIDFIFLELLSNQYKPSFVELHFEACNLITEDNFFGISFRNFFPHSCPLEAGAYHMENLTFPLKNIPASFPFSKGRIIANFTSKDTHEPLGSGHVDMEVKEIDPRTVKNLH